MLLTATPVQSLLLLNFYSGMLLVCGRVLDGLEVVFMYMEELLVCPFTAKPLRLLSDDELKVLYPKVERGELYFRKGVPLEFQPVKAYTSYNQVYVFLEIEGMVFLKKDLAIVPKNRTNHPNKRIDPKIVEAFYQEYGLNRNGHFIDKTSQRISSVQIDEQTWRELSKSMPKHGACMTTLGTDDVDALHNLVFGTTFQRYIHMDHQLMRLRMVNGALSHDTRYVLIDPEMIPLQEKVTDSLFSFNFLDGLQTEEQKELYQSVKSVMTEQATAVMLTNERKSSVLEACYRSDAMSTKARNYLKPWKKQSLPTMLFHRVEQKDKSVSSALTGKTSLGSQLS